LTLSLSLLVTGLPVVLQAAEPNTPDVQTIVEKANIVAYYQGDDGKAKVSMTITTKQGQKRERQFIILRKDVTDSGDQNYFVYFQRPADVRRMVYMVKKRTGVNEDDDRWLYMPALDLVKRIAASDKRTSFVGSDFVYEDVSGRGLNLDTHELIETTPDRFIVKNVPKKPDQVEFSYYTVAIDRENYVPVLMEFYDKEGDLYRTIESQEVETIEDLPTVTKSVVKDLKTGSTTEMVFTEIDYNIGIGDIFEERYLRRPPREATR
jgi:hypothetical protein